MVAASGGVATVGVANVLPAATVQGKKPAGPLPAVFPVPEQWQRPGDPAAGEIEDHGICFYSLAEVFPEAPGIADAFDEDADFRHKLRWATREDLFDPIARFSAKANAKIKALDGTLICSLRRPDRPEEPRPCPELTKLFAERGWPELKGATFIERLFTLCGDVSFRVMDRERASGSFSDIVAPGGGEHKWHQDSGWDKVTVLLGFPAEDRYVGEGVFSHVARLSHALPVPDQAVPLVFGETHCVGGRIPEECVWRPPYRKGAELIAYLDYTTVHSAPDKTYREALWRLQ